MADLHIHSRFSRATSRDMSLESLWKWAQLKGITVVGTGDFTHPLWFRELQEKLCNDGNNLFTLEDKNDHEIPEMCRGEVYFALTAEVSCIYKKNGRVRKVHSLILAPDFAAVSRINAVLADIGNIASDGRPILGLDAKELLKIVLDVSEDALLVPAHAWTPHFSVFGAASGFNTLEECYEELAGHIYAIETGLSSDPPMNRRLSSLDRLTLISNSDAHSPSKLGREANILDTSVTYVSIIEAIKSGKGLLGTVEFFPEEGKYHYDGHRACAVSFSPEETVKHNYLCPVCGRRVTVGVVHRVEELADRKSGFGMEGQPTFHSLIPLQEIVAETKRMGVNTKAVTAEYFNLLEKLGSEFNILLDIPLEEIERVSSASLREAIGRVRSGDVTISPGFDGEYGKVSIFGEMKKKSAQGQTLLS